MYEHKFLKNLRFESKFFRQFLKMSTHMLCKTPFLKLVLECKSCD